MMSSQNSGIIKESHYDILESTIRDRISSNEEYVKSVLGKIEKDTSKSIVAYIDYCNDKMEEARNSGDNTNYTHYKVLIETYQKMLGIHLRSTRYSQD